MTLQSDTKHERPEFTGRCPRYVKAQILLQERNRCAADTADDEV